MRSPAVILPVMIALSTTMDVFAQAPVPEMHRTNVTAPPGTTWQDARSTGGSFTVRMPLPFNDYTVPGQRVRHVIDGKGPTGISFSVVEFVKLTAKGEMDAIYKDLLESPAKTRNMKRERVAGADILSYDSYGALTNSYNRYVETDRSFYFLSIIYQPSQGKEVEPLQGPFFDSFIINTPSAK